MYLWILLLKSAHLAVQDCAKGRLTPPLLPLGAFGGWLCSSSDFVTSAHPYVTQSLAFLTQFQQLPLIVLSIRNTRNHGYEDYTVLF